MPTEATLIALQTAAAWWMAGLCWLVQVVVYPQFGRVDADCFVKYHRYHTTWTSAVVLPVMLIELAAAGTWLWQRPGDEAARIGAALLAVCWVNTFAFEVPLHAKLRHGAAPGLVRRLVWLNLPRTLAWTARGVLLLIVSREVVS